MQKIIPFLWFDNNAEEAMEFYATVFENAKITSRTPGQGGKMLVGNINIEGIDVAMMNGGPHFKLNEAFSLFVRCETQEEIDDKWNKLTTDGGEESMCGWLKDKFGVSWQICPTLLLDLIKDPDRKKADRVMQAMMKMRKIIIADIEAAAKAGS